MDSLLILARVSSGGFLSFFLHPAAVRATVTTTVDEIDTSNQQKQITLLQYYNYWVAAGAINCSYFLINEYTNRSFIIVSFFFIVIGIYTIGTLMYHNYYFNFQTKPILLSRSIRSVVSCERFVL